MIEPEVGIVTSEILATIAREVPEYARPFEGSFGRGVRRGVSEALRQFVELIREPESGRGPGREVYVALGRGELAQGRTLDALQSAYRVGARVAWRHLAGAARRAHLDAEVISALAESMFAFIEEISADSVEGYHQALAQQEGARQRRRRELVAVLLRDPPAEHSDVAAVAEAAAWTVPRSAAALACREADIDRVARRLPADTLSTVVRGVGCALIPDLGGPGRERQTARAAEGLPAALGPPGPVSGLAESWALARSALRALEAGGIGDGGLMNADERLATLLIHDNRRLVERIGERRLAALGPLTRKARRRMEETALAYVQQRGNATAMARAMHVHPQTARYRTARLRELLGDDLDDPDARFELELALRARAAGG